MFPRNPHRLSPSLSFNFLEEFLDKDAFFLLWKSKGSGGKTYSFTQARCKSLQAAPCKQLPFNEDLSSALFNIHLEKIKTSQVHKDGSLGRTFIKSFLFTSYLDKILITAPKLSAMTFINSSHLFFSVLRLTSRLFFHPFLSMEVNFEYMIYLAGLTAPRQPTFSKGWPGSEL